jgi:hypothetical protein
MLGELALLKISGDFSWRYIQPFINAISTGDM